MVAQAVENGRTEIQTDDNSARHTTQSGTPAETRFSLQIGEDALTACKAIKHGCMTPSISSAPWPNGVAHIVHMELQ